MTTNTWKQISAAVQEALVNTFAGPSDVGVYSASVQQTLYEMAASGLRAAPAVEKVQRQCS